MKQFWLALLLIHHNHVMFQVLRQQFLQMLELFALGLNMKYSI
jgi:hypothetical protein